MAEWEHEFTNVNGIRIHYVSAGAGPLVVLLHGFPQFWYVWRHHINALAKHFRVVVPDLRGYGSTDKPSEVSAYNLSVLADDIEGLIQSLGYAKAHIVGHDWGGAIAWRMAIRQSPLIDRMVIINSPHPRKFLEAMRSSLKQKKKSWYMFFFQIPFISELLFKIKGKKILTKILRGSAVRKEAFSDEDLNRYLQELEKPGALRAALNYYRATFRESSKSKKRQSKESKITVPTLLIWGEKDVALGKELTHDMEPLFSGLFRIKYIPDAGHWVIEERPEIVEKLLIEFLL